MGTVTVNPLVMPKRATKMTACVWHVLSMRFGELGSGGDGDASQSRHTPHCQAELVVDWRHAGCCIALHLAVLRRQPCASRRSNPAAGEIFRHPHDGAVVFDGDGFPPITSRVGIARRCWLLRAELEAFRGKIDNNGFAGTRAHPARGAEGVTHPARRSRLKPGTMCWVGRRSALALPGAASAAIVKQRVRGMDDAAGRSLS